MRGRKMKLTKEDCVKLLNKEVEVKFQSIANKDIIKLTGTFTDYDEEVIIIDIIKVEPFTLQPIPILRSKIQEIKMIEPIKIMHQQVPNEEFSRGFEKKWHIKSKRVKNVRKKMDEFIIKNIKFAKSAIKDCEMEIN